MPEAAFVRAALTLRAGQCSVEVGNDVVWVLATHAQSDEIVGHLRELASGFALLLMGRNGWNGGDALDAP